ncbi:unnamed protein product, partial [Mesorhabditis belari]|uniref:Uncharacterized protein n=1 Tax=Mesorhabditis belari TaxID=2138241 RepID=A0AAF3JBW5_9BILA
MSPDGKIHELLIPANTTATLVAHPVAFDNITDGPFIRFAPTIEEGEQHLCHQYMTDITCKGYPLFTMNFGSALGLKYIHDIWYEGFLVISGGTYVHSRAKVTSFNWCPDDPSQIHGFVADASPAGQTARGNVFCTAGTFNITLREMGPMGLLDGRLIDDLVRKHTRVCVTTEDCQNSTDPRHCQDDLLMDIVQYCEKDNEHAYKYSSQCQTLLPFYFNNRRSTLDEANCTKSTLKQTNRIIQHCQMQVKFPLVIITFAAQNDFPLLLAIRPLKWIDPNVDFRWAMLETLNENPNVDYLLPMIVEPSEKPLWIGFSLNAEETWFTILEKLHSEHNDKNCSYEFWYGAAPNKLTPTTENRRLLTFRDEEPFYEQYLDASIFSVFIPPNCAPTIFFRSNRDLIQGNDTTKRQRICSGIHAFISRHFAGYGREIEEGYFLSRTIYCDP